ncbi:hypothetical protein WOLCODRAFT_23750 [Wolfiporia cocos MD-104 SS10]|uniref:Uncharacterized protein n=1 Tax=Wolfiporia cocos (strain MD-104) TaxID=742152 RepID=A0A2H3JCI7_WOLCO|nr:hypothetical protein WOLCODRAFT_23750 [Wolfiporia cocos MD-104 SS10]
MFSSIKSLFVFGALAVSALAQNIAIGAPNDQSSIPSGSNITVQVNRPDSLTGSTEVGIAICLKSCEGYSNGCQDIDVTQALGEVLYVGSYDPEFRAGGWYPYQNFTVQIPSSYTGEAILSVTQLALVGAGPFPYTQTVNVTVNLANITTSS